MQVDGLKAEGIQAEGIQGEKVLNGLIRALRDHVSPSV
jgi:hypothetical protein